jgi:hypothetical protein
MASSSGLPSSANDLTSRVRAVDLEVGAADGELLAVGRMKDEAVAPADPPEDQLRWRLHDVLERSHLLIGRCWGPASRSSGRAACEAVHRDRHQQDQPAGAHDATT